MPYRLAHMLIASGLTAAFLIAGISAYRILHKDPKPAPRMAFNAATLAAAGLIPLQVFLGDLHGLNTLKHQPEKIAAMEAVWNTEKSVPFVLFAIPDAQQQTNRFAIEIPYMASFVLTHKMDGEVKGINEFAGQHPPVAPVFFSFRIMLAVGALMWLLSWWGAWHILRNKPLPNYLLNMFVLMTFSGWLATLAGWYVTEVGRQPWLVKGILTTQQAVTDIGVGQVGISLFIYLTLYVVLLIAYIRTLFVMADKAILIDAPNF
jgi:cytochrome bd ubiquinol oxidase subunit I